MNHLKGVIIAGEAFVLLVLGTTNIVSGQFLAAAILFGVASLAAACAWALWPAQSPLIRLAGERPHRARWSRRRRR